MDGGASTPQIPGFDVVGTLGSGGFGVVYDAVQLSIDRRVALKVLKGAYDDTEQRRFRSECRAVGRLSWHPNVVAVYEAGITPDGSPYMAMELVPGGSVSDSAPVGHPMAAEDVIRVGADIAGALQAAHELDIIHRDVKPENILVDRLGGYLLADFGIATLLDGSRSATGGFVGTVSYSAPELLEGQPANAASDIYALGATLHRLAAGASPYGGLPDEAIGALLLRIVNSDPAPLPPSVPRPLAEVISRAMAKDPAQRFATAADMRDALLSTQRPTVEPELGEEETVRHALATPPPPAPPAPAPTPTDGEASGETSDPGPGRRRGRQVVVGLAALFVVALGAAVWFALSGDDEPTEPAAVPPIVDDGTAEVGRAVDGVIVTRVYEADGSKAVTEVTIANETDEGVSLVWVLPMAPEVAADRSAVVVDPEQSGFVEGDIVAPYWLLPLGARETAILTATVDGFTGTSQELADAQQQALRTFDGWPEEEAAALSIDLGAPVAWHGASPKDMVMPSRADDELTEIDEALPAEGVEWESAEGLPAGVELVDGRLVGTIDQDAVTQTTDRRSIAAVPIDVTLTGTRPDGSPVDATFTWVVNDSHRIMPDYVGKYGCGLTRCDGGGVGIDVADLSEPDFACAIVPEDETASLIVSQSVPPGEVIEWGQTIGFVYGEHAVDCPEEERVDTTTTDPP